MTYEEILTYAQKGMDEEKRRLANARTAAEKEKDHDLVETLQKQIDEVTAQMEVLGRIAEHTTYKGRYA